MAQIAKDIFSIPAMSAEVERLFSLAKLMVPHHRSTLRPEAIEAGECLRSWTMGGVVLNEYFEYLTASQKAGEKWDIIEDVAGWE